MTVATDWRDLYEREYPRLLRALTAIGGDADAAADRADLLAALRELPDRQRSMVVARYYYGLSYDEIAAEFGVRGGTVGATLNQALGKLRQLQVAGKLARGSMA